MSGAGWIKVNKKPPRCPLGVRNPGEVAERIGVGNINIVRDKILNNPQGAYGAVMGLVGVGAKTKVKSGFNYATVGMVHANPGPVQRPPIPEPAFRSPKGHRIQCVEIPKEAPLLPVLDYIRVRFSEDLVHRISQHGVLVVFGTNKDTANYMISRGYQLCQDFGTRSSASFSLYHKAGDKKQATVVAHGIPSDAKFVDFCLRLAHCNIDITQKVVAAGDPSKLIQASANGLRYGLRNIDTSRMICFIGSPFRVLPDADARKVTSGLFSGLMKGDTLALWISNGEATYEMIHALIDGGIKRIVWCGAGCSLKPNARIGDYQIVHEVGQYQYGQPIVGTPNYRLGRRQLWWPHKRSWIDNQRTNHHLTVDSPLQETKAMTKEAIAAGYNSFDVELSHAIRAVDERSDMGVRLMAGFFVSDTLRDPLHNKIGHNALGKIPALVQLARGSWPTSPSGRLATSSTSRS